jgi:hypothetical protein
LAVKQSRELAGELQKAGNGADVLVVDYATKRSELAAHMQIMDDLSNPRHAMTERILAFIGAEK